MFRLIVDGEEIPYILKVSKRRKTLGLRIDHRGLTLHIPSRAPKKAVENFLQDHTPWISRKLREWRDRPAAPEPLAWDHGASLLLLGQPLTLTLQEGKRARVCECNGALLTVQAPDAEDHDTIRRAVVRWLAKQAREDFQRRLELLSAKMGVNTPALFLSSARTRWGSCNSRGEIRLNWRLIQAPPRIIHYVICHELAHLKEMNHSPRFWNWVGQLCPDYRTLREELKGLSPQLHLV